MQVYSGELKVYIFTIWESFQKFYSTNEGLKQKEEGRQQVVSKKNWKRKKWSYNKQWTVSKEVKKEERL